MGKQRIDKYNLNLAGEYRVAAELCLRGLFTSVTYGNKKGADLYAIGEKSIGICANCNNGVLSQLDRELCNRSYLSVIASREIDESFWHAWDVDHRDGNVFVEAKPKWQDGTLSSFVCYPQMTFDRSGAHFRGDAKEVLEFGFQDFQRVISAAANRCFREFCGGKTRKIHFEKIPLSLIGDENRFPPRLFFRKSVRELAHKQFSSCVIRFCHEDDKRMVFRELDKLDYRSLAKPNWTISPSSKLPRFAIAFDIGDVLRCMIKIGLNLIAYISTATDIRAEGFAWARRIITGELPVVRELIARNGFVRPESVSFLNAATRTHKFRLSYWDGRWRVYSAYFGGDIGSFVEFPGINNEPWRTADCEVGLDKDHFSVEKYSIALPANSQPIEWTNSREICPSVDLISFASKFEVEMTQKNRAP